MDIDQRSHLEVLDDGVCWEFLRATEIGRLCLAVEGRPELFPMQYQIADGDIVFRTEEGTKLTAATAGPLEAVLEIDAVSEQFRLGWSVMARGQLDRVSDPYEVSRCELLGLQAWADGSRPNWLRLTAAEVTGRRIIRGPQEFTD